MRAKYIVTVLCLFVDTQVQMNPSSPTYKAAVVTLPGLEVHIPDATEFPTLDAHERAVDQKLFDLIENNIKIYENHINDAGKQSVDIMVFPEATMNYFGMRSREAAEKFAVTLPSIAEDIIPCEEGKFDKILFRLCQAVRKAGVYTVVNVIEKVHCAIFPNQCDEKDEVNLFNTNIVFDRAGKIISRYRKLNLFTEPMLNVPKLNEMEPFETDFGEKFFTAICFDLLFKTPTIDVIKSKGVKNIILSTMWFSQAPFLTAPQAQLGFAQANDVNLLAACGQWLSHGATGSGIYAGAKGPLQMHFEDSSVGKMLVAAVPKRLHSALDSTLSLLDNLNIDQFIDLSAGESTFKNAMPNLHIKQHPFPLTDAKFEPIKETHTECIPNTNFIEHCCDYNLNFKKHEVDEAKGHKKYHYFFATYFGVRKFGGKRLLGELFCAIVACIGNIPSKHCGQRHPATESIIHKAIDFHKAEVTMRTRAHNNDVLDNMLVMPTTLNSNLMPLHPRQYNFESRRLSQVKGARISFEKSTEFPSNLFTFGFYGRNFNDDNSRN